MVVTFLGHRNSPPDLQPQLESLLIHLIEHQGASHFYIGNHGNFDCLVRRTLEKLSSCYTHIHFEVVLAYLPTKNKTACSFSIFPEGLESVHPKYAITKRNRWMIEHSDCVVAYVTHHFGGAAQFLHIAEQKKKLIFNLAVDIPE